MRECIVVVRFAFIIGTVACVGDYAQAAQTGVEGTVSASPVAPGAQLPGGSPATRLANSAVQVSDRQGHVIAQAASNEQGQFTLLVPAGDYQIRASPPTSPFPRCKVSSIRVSSDRLTHVDIVCNSGIQ
jgi:type 1 fimbria pilin